MEITSFPQRISKIYGNRNFEDLVLFENYNLKLKIGRCTPNMLPTNLGCHCGVRQLSGGVLYPFFPFNHVVDYNPYHKFLFEAILMPR